MFELTLTDPALLFSAISLILLAYTNRFLSYAQLVRTLQDKYREHPDLKAVAQIVLGGAVVLAVGILIGWA